MSRVTIKVYSSLREKLGFSQKEIEAKTLKEAVKKITEKSNLKNILFENKNKIWNYYVITVNSEIVDNSKISKIKLSDGDIINIFPPVAGG